MKIPFFHKKDKILVVEDSDTLSKAINTKLQTYEFDVLIAKSADQAIGVLKKNKDIKIVWLDHWLRDHSDGLTVLKYIREQSEFDDIPVFIVSASGDEMRKQYMDMGATKFYVKSDHLMTELVEEMIGFLK